MYNTRELSQIQHGQTDVNEAGEQSTVTVLAVRLRSSSISHFRNVFKLSTWMFRLLKPSDQPFHSHASFNVISTPGIQHAHMRHLRLPIKER